MKTQTDSRKERGDTIVEVLIVLTIVSLALSISYAIANRSLLGVRRSQEHSEALQLAQTQIERLRQVISTAPPSVVQPTSGYFCMYDNAGVSTPKTENLVATPFDLSTYASECQSDSNSSGTKLYGVAISYDPVNFKYTVRVQWDDISANHVDSVSLIYKVYP